ncbi:MAG: D-glycero-beta-D-manno-heptose-7-phosphate kinase [Candidatus Cloacimonadaceae bacterium]|jgi:D-beta-D-heptose 7-phosphate kinase/D-beta-D-heptose 1-phosphate adenosyltransferase|nr:D-glycero-beta-D-manno-heptose-7-phosphate kinase [Candidatus Cloacimonadota bacterium]MDX9950184.1 D-glycero-beta-D-manno-heptose-7-phosphate kinase [Candidatus Syntrophosphaera sp.]NLN85117.1 D-glycero-beta-D-manno-heptose-7-phosphate kinase [Candidatus Cloacimonadota bacterium]
MIANLLDKFKGKKILVLGDVMLDQYVWGKVERISAEAPVPVLEAQSEELRLGGAANVALNIHSLGGTPLLVGVTGADQAGEDLMELLEKKGISASGIQPDPSRGTTCKKRIGAANQQIVRIDYENRDDLSSSIRAKVLEKTLERLQNSDALIIQDYEKGLLAEPLIREVLKAAKEQDIPVAVDPKLKNFQAYEGVDIFKPNYNEFQAIRATIFDSDEAFFRSAVELRKELNFKNLIVTRSSLGMYIFNGDKEPRRIPTYAQEVFDPSGAGDTVISALTLAWTSGADIDLAAELANHAAGVVCGIKGTASVTPQQVLASYRDQK